MIGPDYVEGLLMKAIAQFHVRDESLLDWAVHEVAAAHRIGVYLEQLGDAGQWDSSGALVHVDLEYNRFGEDADNIKVRPDGAKVRPDILVHRRGDSTAQGCFAAIEVKARGKDAAVRDDFSSGVTTFLGDDYLYPVFFYVDLRRVSPFAELTRVNRGAPKLNPDPRSVSPLVAP